MTWAERWAYVRYDLGLSTEEFWDLTPGEVLHVEARHRRGRRERWWIAAELWAQIGNFSMNKPKNKRFHPNEFMPPDLKNG